MEFQSIMHVSFYADDLNKIYDFYTNILEAKPKMLVRYKAYASQEGHPFQKMGQEHPDDICIVYFEIAPGQFVEFFPKYPGQKEHAGFNERIGYSHLSLLVEDIHKTRDELAAKGVEIDVEPKIGNSNTWQMWIHDPEGNKFEIMQYTPDSYQLTGHIDQPEQ